MKTHLPKLLIFSLIVFSGINSFAQTYDSTWTHHEIKSLNLKFDLPSQFYFDYNDSTGFSGSSMFARFELSHLDEEIIGLEAMDVKLYTILGIDTNQYPINDDPHYQHGTTESGYLMAGTIVEIENAGGQAMCFIMSDKSNPRLNFFLMGQYGGNSTSGSAGYGQVIRFIKSVGPIVKTE